MKKLVITLVFCFLAILFAPTEKINAYPGGILDGKPLWIGDTGTTTKLATDNNETSCYTLPKSLNGAPPLNYHLGWAGSAADTATITQYQLKGSGTFRLDLFKPDGTLIVKIDVTPDGLKHALNYPNVGMLSLWNVSTTSTANVCEFDLFGTYTDKTPPSVPSGITSSSTVNSVTLNWKASTDNYSGVKGYNVYRGATKITATPINALTFTDTGLNDDTNYTYQLTAVDNANNESAKSTAVSVKTLKLMPPTAPEGIYGVIGNTEATVNWSAVENATGYHIYRDGVRITSSPITATSYTVTGLINGKTYGFEVSAVNPDGESSKSNAIYLTPQDAPKPPIAPPGIYGDAGNTKVIVNWSAVGNATGYYVYQDGVKITGSPITTTSYTITGLANGRTYHFEVSAVNDNGESIKSAVDLMPHDPPPPPTPINLVGTAGDKQATLAWNKVTEANKGYNVYQDGVKITKSPITVTTFKVTGLTNGKEYKFEVTSIAASEAFDGESPKSAAVKVTPNSGPPATPGGLSGTVGDKQVVLTWTMKPDMGYYIYVNGVKVNSSPLYDNTYTVTGLENDKKYSFQISAFNEFGESKLTGALSRTPSAPKFDLGDAKTPFSAKDMVSTGFSFMKLYLSWILLGLGVIFALVIVMILFWISKKTKAKAAKMETIRKYENQLSDLRTKREEYLKKNRDSIRDKEQKLKGFGNEKRQIERQLKALKQEGNTKRQRQSRQRQDDPERNARLVRQYRKELREYRKKYGKINLERTARESRSGRGGRVNRPARVGR